MAIYIMYFNSDEIYADLDPIPATDMKKLIALGKVSSVNAFYNTYCSRS